MRLLAIVMLCAAGVAAEDDLLPALMSPEQSTRVSAAVRVRALSAPERTALAKRLAVVLKDGDRRRRRAAARGLEVMGPEARAAVPALVAVLADSDRVLRMRAIDALAEIDDSTPATVQALVEAALDSDAGVRGSAIVALWDVGGTDEGVMDALIEGLRDPSQSNRWRAAIALGRRRNDAGRAAKALGAALGDEAAEVRKAAIEALQALGEAARPAGRDLIAQLSSKDTEFVLDVAGVLGAMKTPPELVVPRIKVHLADKRWKIRSGAAWAISKFEDGARLAMTELEVAARDEHPAVRRTALQAIYAAYPKRPGAYDAYQKAYDEEQKWRVLDHYKHDLKAAMEGLCQGLREGTEITRVVAAANLGNLGADARSAIPALLAALKDPSVRVRASTLGALADIRVADATPLLAYLASPNPEIREEAVEAVGRARELDVKALRAVVACLADDAEDVRDQARWTLDDLGGQAKPALPELRKLLKHSDEMVRDAARDAIEAIVADEG